MRIKGRMDEEPAQSRTRNTSSDAGTPSTQRWFAHAVRARTLLTHSVSSWRYLAGMRNKDHVSSERLEHLVRGLKPAQFVASGSWTNPVPVLRPVGIDTSQDSNDGDLLVIMSTLSQAQAAGQAAVFASAPAAGKARAAHDVEGQQATTAADLWCPQQLDASLATAGGVEGSMTTPANPGSAVEALLGDCALQQNFLTSTTENDGIPGKSTSAINRTNARNALASPHCNQRRCDSGEKTTEAAMQMVREEENAWQEWKHSELAAWSPPELSFPQAHPPNQIVEVDPDTEAHTRKHTTGVEPTPPIMRCTSIQEEDFNVTRTVGPLHRSASLPSRTSHLLEQNLSPTKTKNSILTKMSRATSALAQLRLKHSVFLTWVIIMKTTRNRTTYLRRPFGWWLRWTQWKTFLRQTVVKADRIQRQRCKNLALCRWACAVVVQAQIEDVIHYHRQRKLSRFFSSWSSRMVVRTIFHVTCLHDRIRMLREGFFCWACGSAWNLHKRRSITAAAYKRMRDHFRAWQAWVEESALCNEQHLHASLQQSLSKLAIHSVDSSLLRLTSTRQQQRMLCGSFVLWAQVLLDESQVEQGARDAKDRCLQELCMQAKLNLAAQRNSFLQRCSHAIE